MNFNNFVTIYGEIECVSARTWLNNNHCVSCCCADWMHFSNMVKWSWCVHCVRAALLCENQNGMSNLKLGRHNLLYYDGNIIEMRNFENGRCSWLWFICEQQQKSCSLTPSSWQCHSIDLLGLRLQIKCEIMCMHRFKRFMLCKKLHNKSIIVIFSSMQMRPQHNTL